MSASIQRFGLIAGTLLSTAVLCTICGCSRMTGFVMNESGQAYYRAGNYTMAQHEFQKALIDDPGNPHYLYNLAAATHKQGNIAQAEQLYQQTIQLDPSHQPAYHGLASLMVDQGRTSEAESMLSAWAGSQPYVAESHVELAWLQQETGNPEQAEASLRQALQIDPRNDHAIAHLGQIYEKQGRSAEAMAMYERSLFVDPTQHGVRSRLAALQDHSPYSDIDTNAGGPNHFAANPTGMDPYYGGGMMAQQPWQSAPTMASAPYGMPGTYNFNPTVAYNQQLMPGMTPGYPQQAYAPGPSPFDMTAAMPQGQPMSMPYQPGMQAPMMAAPTLAAPTMAAPTMATQPQQWSPGQFDTAAMPPTVSAF